MACKRGYSDINLEDIMFGSRSRATSNRDREAKIRARRASGAVTDLCRWLLLWPLSTDRVCS